jgi:hypothetical protein
VIRALIRNQSLACVSSLLSWHGKERGKDVPGGTIVLFACCAVKYVMCLLH